MDQDRYATSVVAKYLETSTIKENPKFHNTTLTHDMIITKEDASTSDEQVYLLSREYIIHYRACVGSLIYNLSIRAELCFSVHKMAIVFIKYWQSTI